LKENKQLGFENPQMEFIDRYMAERLIEQGLTTEGKRMLNIIDTLNLAAAGNATGAEFRDALHKGALLAAQLREASRPDQADEIETIVSNITQIMYSPSSGSAVNNGPNMWPLLKPEWWRCGQTDTQSPIDLGSLPPTSERFWQTNLNRTLWPNNVTYSNSREDGLQFHYGEVTSQLINEGLYFRINMTQGSEVPKFRELGHNSKRHFRHNRYVGGDYTLEYAKIHTPAEHTIQGKRYPMEMQLYHTNPDGHVVAIAVMFEFGFSNPYIESVLPTMPLECSGADPVKITRPQDVLPISLDYYAYEGSMTQPPCATGVSWYVLKETSTISIFQYVKFVKTLGTQEKYRMHCGRFGCSKTPLVNAADFPFSETLQGNARPLQPQGHRIIRESRVRLNEETSPQLDVTEASEDNLMGTEGELGVAESSEDDKRFLNEEQLDLL